MIKKTKKRVTLASIKNTNEKQILSKKELEFVVGGNLAATIRAANS